MNDMNKLRSHELRAQHRTMDDINDFESWAQGSRCYRKLKAIDDMNDFESWALGFSGNEQLIVVDHINDLML